MLREISSEQLLEWVVFSELEPFEPERLEQVVVSVAQAIYNVNRDRKKRKEPFTIDDCLPRFGDNNRPKKAATPIRRSWQAMKALAVTLTDDSKQSAPGRREKGD